MSVAIESLLKSGTKLWVDSVDPDLVKSNFAMGATGATSNPIIIADLIKTGRFDESIREFALKSRDAESVAWMMTDFLVTEAEKIFRPVYDRTKGNDGYVSFELDPLIEDATNQDPISMRAQQYIQLGKKWSQDHPNRMIKVPATPAGLASLEDLAACGIPLNVTLIFSQRQYETARNAVWKGAQRAGKLQTFKSVYSIFVSRIDVYASQKYPRLSEPARGLAGIVNAKLLFANNQAFWNQHPTPLRQEIIFASTGTKNPDDKPWKYVAALAGSDIQTNPPSTNDAVAKCHETFTKEVFQLPSPPVVDELMTKIDWQSLESDLMREGLAKFADPHKSLIALVKQKIGSL